MSDKKSEKRTDKNNKKRKVSIVRVLLVAIILIGFIGAGAAAGIVMSIIKTAEPIDASNIYDMLDESSFILDSEGQVIEQIQSNNFRVVIDYADMPQHLKDAFVSIEDERFWTHKGVDVKRIFGALWTNVRTGSRQGASTINQQLAVNLYLSRSDKSYARKIKDAYYGIMLDRQLSKEQILEAYLNTIYLGSSAHGVQAAAQVYFSKDAKDLTIAESALIAGITRYPSRNTPIITLEKEDVKEHHIILDDSDPVYTVVMNDKIDEYVIKRQKLVLNSMKRLGYITEEQYNQALEEDVKSHLKPNRLIAEDISSFFGDLVKRDVIKALENHGYSNDEATNMLYSGGLRINSTLDTRIQKILDEEYANSNNFPKIRNTDKAILLAKEGFTEDEQKNIRDNDGQIQPQSAMVISDHRTGEIKAIVGGRMTSGQRILNRALSPRQPGSSIKPIAIYAPAIERGFTAASVIDDVPSYFNRATPNEPWPKNFDRTYRGLITLREAVERSNNLVAVKLGSSLAGDQNSSISTMLDYMKNMGISTVHSRENPLTINGKKYTDETLSTALGGMTRGVSPLEMNTAFNVLANGGMYTNPITFTSIYDRHGNLILENTPQQHRVLTPQTAYVVTDMLRGVVSSPRGTGRGASIGSMPVAGKTGTTDSQKDAWFVGYTPYYSASVWIGSDQPVALTSGSPAAAALWSKVMKRVHEGHTVKDFEMPSDIVRVNVCTISGKLPTELCALDPRGSTVRSEIFVKGTEPTATDTCDVHVLADIHVPSGKLATDLTPPWQVESKVFVQRPVPYNPSEHGGIAPLDYIYDLPTEYYDPLVDGFGSPFPGGSPDGWETDGEQDEQNPDYTDENFIDLDNNN